MKFVIVSYDPALNDSVISGGDVFLWNIMLALKKMGHSVTMVNTKEAIPQCDFIIIQSEWYGHDTFREHRQQVPNAKLIVILGHFIGNVYFDPTQIEADYFISTWKGDCIDAMPQEVYYFPHAYPEQWEPSVAFLNRGKCVFIGNTYPLRNEDWFDGLHFSRITKEHPRNISKIYQSAIVCLNLHGDFQKGIVATHSSRVADKPGYALNERLFWVAGAGGFQIVDEHPLIWEMYKKDEIVTASSKEEYQEKVKYYLENTDRRWSFIEKAHARTLQEHTYTKRLAKLFDHIGIK